MEKIYLDLIFSLNILNIKFYKAVNTSTKENNPLNSSSSFNISDVDTIDNEKISYISQSNLMVHIGSYPFELVVSRKSETGQFHAIFDSRSVSLEDSIIYEDGFKQIYTNADQNLYAYGLV